MDWGPCNTPSFFSFPYDPNDYFERLGETNVTPRLENEPLYTSTCEVTQPLKVFPYFYFSITKYGRSSSELGLPDCRETHCQQSISTYQACPTFVQGNRKSLFGISLSLNKFQRRHIIRVAENAELALGDFIVSVTWITN